MLMHISLAPFLWKRSAALARKADLDEVPQGRCPVCGDLPVMGLMNEEGLRILECSLCGTRWVFPRMMCPFCNNTDQGMLSYIFVEGDRSRRAYLCDACKRYIKVSEAGAGRLEEKVMALEDLATAHLDQAAEQRGYERGCRTAFC
jgi:FdhE protein